MKKPTLVKDIVILITLNILFFVWVFWYLINGKGSGANFTIIWYVIGFALIELVYIVSMMRRYQDAYKIFTQNIKAMGNKQRIVDYKIQEYEVNGTKNYYLTTEIDFGGKKKRIRKILPKELAGQLKKTPVPLSLFTDPSSSTKLIYYLDLPLVNESK